jgi:hypothetical protein
MILGALIFAAGLGFGLYLKPKPDPPALDPEKKKDPYADYRDTFTGRYSRKAGQAAKAGEVNGRR